MYLVVLFLKISALFYSKQMRHLNFDDICRYFDLCFYKHITMQTRNVMLGLLKTRN